MPAKLTRPIGPSRTLNRQPAPEKPEQTAPANAPDDSLLLPAEAAKRLAVSEHALERWRGTGQGPRYIRITAKTLRYRAADLDAFVAARAVASTAAR